MFRYFPSIRLLLLATQTAVVVTALAAFVRLAGTTQANLIANGSFSVNASRVMNYPGYCGGGNGNPASPTGWQLPPYSASTGAITIGVNGPSTVFFKAKGMPFAPASLAGVHNFAFIQNAGKFLSQTVPTVAGHAYTLTYDAAARNGESSDKLEVAVTDATTGRKIATQVPAISDSTFASFMLFFTAHSASTKITWLNKGANGTTVDVSGVSLVLGRAAPTKYLILGVNRTQIFDGQSVVATVIAKTAGADPFAPASMAGVRDFAFIQNGGNEPANSISQTIPVIAGKQYQLTYDAAARRGETSDVLAVILTDAANGHRLAIQIPAISDTAFRPFTLTFTAPSASIHIEFVNHSTVGAGQTVDVSKVALRAAGTSGANLIANGDFSVNAWRYILAPGYVGSSNPAAIEDWVAGVGSDTIGVNGLTTGTGMPISGLKVRAYVNGQPWCASETTLPSGLAHLLLPLPEVGTNVITVRGGGATSAPVTVQVKRRTFHIITDPKHLIGMEYETWFGPGYAKWGHEEAIPILGRYSSLDPRVLRQQTLWFNQMGINFVEQDWTNNLVKPFPDAAARECIAANKVLFHLYAHMRQHPKIVFLMGPEHNYWINHTTPYTGPWFKAQLNYVYAHFINNPKYRDLYLHYHGKPLLLLYLNGPRFARPPVVHDPRFAIRYVGAWLQYTKENRYGVWSWYDQKATPTFYHGKAEALTVASGYPATQPPGTGLNNWLSPDAGGKNYGETYRTQWRVADKYRPHFLFLCQWNQFEPPDQYSVNLSNDMEPTLMTELGSHRPSGWGFFYLELTRWEIDRYHRLIAATRDPHHAADER